MSWRIAARSVTPWTPAQISTALWLDGADASTVLLNGSNVSQWNDKSGNNRNVGQNTAVNRPIYTTNAINGKNVLTWPSSTNSTGLTNVSLSAFSPGRTFGVARWIGPTTFTTYNYLYSYGFSSTDEVIGNIASTSLFSGSLFMNGSSSATANVLGLMANVFIFASNRTAASGRTVVSIGTDGGSDRGWQGLIAEVITTVSVPDTITKQLVEGYLAHKWGLTANLPNDHPYKVNPPYV